MVAVETPRGRPVLSAVVLRAAVALHLVGFVLIACSGRNWVGETPSPALNSWLDRHREAMALVGVVPTLGCPIAVMLGARMAPRRSARAALAAEAFLLFATCVDGAIFRPIQ